MGCTHAGVEFLRMTPCSASFGGVRASVQQLSLYLCGSPVPNAEHDPD